MFFRATGRFAYANGGRATLTFLKGLGADWQNGDILIDSRCRMLMPGWYPCIPGYHHDDVPRERSDGQPEYFNPSYRSRHAMVLYNGKICPTEFAIGESEFEDVPLGQVYYKQWHPEVVAKISSGDLKMIQAPENQIIYFNDRTWHQGTKAVANGFRLFIRATIDSGLEPKNEIRKQVQVYLEKPMEGW
jgi:hypothetical protein